MKVISERNTQRERKRERSELEQQNPTDSVDRRMIEGKRLLYVTARTLARYLAAPWYSRHYGDIAFRQWNIRRTSTYQLPVQIRRVYLSHRYVEFTTKNDMSHVRKRKYVSTDKSSSTNWATYLIGTVWISFLSSSLFINFLFFDIT